MFHESHPHQGSGHVIKRPSGTTNGTSNGYGADGHGHANGHANGSVVPIRSVGQVMCSGEVLLVVRRFMSFGRLPHLRSRLLAHPSVQSAKIKHYADFTATFSLTVSPPTRADSLQLPGTQLLSSDGAQVELTVT